MGAKHSQLSPRDISSIRKETKFTEDEIRCFYTAFVRRYPNGKLSKSDLAKVYKEVYPKGNPEDIVAEFFQEYDVDRNGSIDFREFLCGLGLLMHGTQDEKLKLAFGMYDIDSNGFISAHELQKLVQAIFKSHSKSKLYDEKMAELVAGVMFKQLDANSDNRITLAEFIEGAKKDPRLLERLQVDVLKI